MLPAGTKVRFRHLSGLGRVWTIVEFDERMGYYVLSDKTMTYFAKAEDLELWSEKPNGAVTVTNAND